MPILAIVWRSAKKLDCDKSTPNEKNMFTKPAKLVHSQPSRLAMVFVHSSKNSIVPDIEDEEFILDSGAKHHIFSELSLFPSFKVTSPCKSL